MWPFRKKNQTPPEPELEVELDDLAITFLTDESQEIDIIVDLPDKLPNPQILAYVRMLHKLCHGQLGHDILRALNDSDTHSGKVIATVLTDIIGNPNSPIISPTDVFMVDK